MFFAKYILKDRVLRLNGLNKQIKETQENIDIEKGRFYAHLYDLRLALEECVCAYSKPRLYQLMLNTIKHVNQNLESVETAENLKQDIESVIELFDDFDYQEHYSGDLTYSYRSLENVRSIDVECLDPIINEINKMNRSVTLFEPGCAQGDNFQYMKRDNLLCYGTEESNDIAIAKEHAAKVVKGKLAGSKIKNDAFDILIAKCSLGLTLEDNMSQRGSINKIEKDFITNVNKYLRPNGIVLFVLPYYRMHKDICEHIAKYYDNVRILKATGAYWQEKKYVYIYGQKSLSKEMNEEIYERLRSAFNPDLIPEFNQDVKLNYRLPASHIAIDILKGSVLDMDELYEIVDTSGVLDSFFKSQEVEKIGSSSTKPLLPFNIGQLGLVLTSGCLDGIIDEGDGNYHLVKGKVSKKSDTKRQVVDGICEESETISNRVEINVLLPNGEYKVLT